MRIFLVIFVLFIAFTTFAFVSKPEVAKEIKVIKKEIKTIAGTIKILEASEEQVESVDVSSKIDELKSTLGEKAAKMGVLQLDKAYSNYQIRFWVCITPALILLLILVGFIGFGIAMGAVAQAIGSCF